MTQPGALMAAEIIEQPAVWRRLLTDGREQSTPSPSGSPRSHPTMVLFVARGTSDHAALYGKYLTEIVAQRPAGLVSPSTMTAYGARPEPGAGADGRGQPVRAARRTSCSRWRWPVSRAP